MDRAYQVCYTTPSTNGYPRKLIFVYELRDGKFTIVEVYKSTMGFPNIVNQLKKEGVPHLLEMQITPKDYKDNLSAFEKILKKDLNED